MVSLHIFLFKRSSCIRFEWLSYLTIFPQKLIDVKIVWILNSVYLSLTDSCDDHHTLSCASAICRLHDVVGLALRVCGHRRPFRGCGRASLLVEMVSILGVMAKDNPFRLKCCMIFLGKAIQNAFYKAYELSA